MKEFGFYTVKKNYIDKFLAVEPNLGDLKSEYRPFLCIKISVAQQNWLIPIASINPAAPNYFNKVDKYRNFADLDKEQARKDGNQFARAINIFRDLTGLQDNPKFMSVVEYYNAIPVKHKYCKKYRDRTRKHICIEDTKLREVIKKTLVVNIKAKLRGEEVGFIKAKIAEGQTNFVNYSKKSLEIREELYKEHFALLKAEQKRKQLSEQRIAEAARKKELKNSVKKIEIEPQLIYGRTANGDVNIKLPGATPEAPKTRITLPKGDVVLDREQTHVIGTTPELQQRYNLKLPGGQARRVLK